MEARLIDKSDHSNLKEWYHKHNLDAPPEQYYPSWGLIVEGVAAGFLFATDTALCMLDGYITNPEATSVDRNKAIALITGELLEISKEQGFQRVMVFSKEDSIIKRAKNLKFTDKGSYVMLDKEV